MIKYLTIGAALKGFSCAPPMRALYRRLGNRVGDKRRSSGALPGYYADRVKRMLHLTRVHKVVRDGDRILELGTGWMHWEALTLRLFFDVEAVLFDVWDNRQLGGLKNHLGQLGPMLNDGFGLSPAELERAQSLIKAVLEVQSFEDLYELLGFKYVVENSGSLSQFADGDFQLVVSAGVLEHVKREAVSQLVAETRRVLKQGGWAMHSIDTSDHLSHYDATVSKKMYLSFSEPAWKLLCANEVQYINRMQRGEWLELFEENDFELVNEERMQTDITKLRLAARFARMEKLDLESTVLRLAFRRSQASKE